MFIHMMTTANIVDVMQNSQFRTAMETVLLHLQVKK